MGDGEGDEDMEVDGDGIETEIYRNVQKNER
jgi:hypothetical protein